MLGNFSRVLVAMTAALLVSSLIQKPAKAADLGGDCCADLEERVAVLDGPIAPLACLSATAYRPCADCQTEKNCEIRRVFARVAESARHVLDRTTIADALKEGLRPDAFNMIANL